MRKLSIEQKRRKYCAVHGHPGVVNVCMGQVTCARCNAILGDVLGADMDLSQTVILKHATRAESPSVCQCCRKLAAKLRRVEITFLPPEARAEIRMLQGKV